MLSRKAIYCRNKPGKTPDKISYFQFPSPETEGNRGEIWLKNICTGYNINTCQTMFSVVTISMEIVFKTTCKLNNLGLSQSQEL